MNILITGGTGFLGEYLVRELSHKFHVVYILTRQKSCHKFTSLKNIQLVSGDITDPEVIPKAETSFLDTIDVVLHAAALYEMTASYDDCFLQNVKGTQNILNLLLRMKNLKSFYYISTIAVGDLDSLKLEENQLTDRAKFIDAYSETKFLAEKLVRDNVASVNYVTRIIRPGIIVGDSLTGDMPKTDGPYYFIKVFKKYSKFLKFIPGIVLSFNPKTKLPIIPVDHCARFISILIVRDRNSQKLRSYHLISSEVPTLSELLSDLNNMLGLKIFYYPVKRNFIHSFILRALGIPKAILPFMFSRISYDMSNTLEDLPELKESVYGAFKNALFKK